MRPIYGVLNREQIEHVKGMLRSAPFRSGKETAGPAARHLKDNMQADSSDPTVCELAAFVEAALTKHSDFRLYARPVRWSRCRFSRYREGQQYGRHYDNWNLKGHDGQRMRSDLSFTLFLTEPESYQGGELALDKPEGRVTVKLPLGAAFVYPTNVLHEVLPVTSGERLVCIGWVQSQVRSHERRELLYDLDRVLANMSDGDAKLLLDKSIGTLLRMWAELN